MRPILTSPRVVRTGNPLSLEGIRAVCPAVFALEPHHSRGPKYRYIPTIEPLENLLENGWGVYEASQQRSRDGGKDPYTKHMLRLRRLTDFDPRTHTSLDGVPEVIMLNAHDGTAHYKLAAGFFRFVCSNGLIVGTKLAEISVVHTVGRQTSQEVLEAAERVVTEKFPVMLENIDRFKSIRLERPQAFRLAEKAYSLRYGTTLASINASDLMALRRPEDEEPTLWNWLNRIQENAVYGGMETKSFAYGRHSVVRPVERVSAVTKINSGLWDEALEIAEEMV